MEKTRVFSAQFNYQYGSVIHFPFSIGSLVAYIKSFPELEPHFEFEKTFVFRNKLDEYIERCVDVDILLCSCYTWNWEITTRLAAEVKRRNPKCLVIFGGPQVPDHYAGDVPLKWVPESTGTFFGDYPFVDIIAHQEAEHTTAGVFRAYLGDRDYSGIDGLETKDFRTPPAARIQDLNELPSPYLTDLVWDLVEPVEGVSYIASWETNRGCPFACTFCDWGSATKTKVRNRDVATLFQEIEWFADNKISYIDCCDANFGIYTERDLSLARKFKEEKLAKGFPGRVRPAWVKSSTQKVIPIAKELQEADLLRSVTLAVQSLDPDTLKTIKRSNIKFDKFSNLVAEFMDHGIETYTEIIMGLPGATLPTYLDGLEQFMELFPRPVLFIYNCGVFVNAPMNQEAYVKEHELEVIKSPIYLWHSSIYNRGEIPEYEFITTAAKTFTPEDLRQMYQYGWAAQAFHSLGITEYVAKFYHQLTGLKYVDFYEAFFEYCRSGRGAIFGREYQIVSDYITTGYGGGGWDHHDPDLAPIFWPIEEATWLRCVRDSQELGREIRDFMDFFEERLGYQTPAAVLDDLAAFQVFILSTMDHKEPIKTLAPSYAWREFFLTDGKDLSELGPASGEYSWANKVTETDLAEWCYKAIWVGRNQCNYKVHADVLIENSLATV
jgi:radical SAM superfamily enzyme YgiQ (UPF0313 family)